MADANQPQEQIVRIPFFSESDIRSGQEGFLTKDQVFLNGYFEPIQILNEVNYHFAKRPGLSTAFTVSPTGPGRGCYRWKKTGHLYSVNNNKILSGTTDLGVTLSTTTGFVDFAETRPGAAAQYLGVNDGAALYLIGSDDSVIILNNKTITSSSVANPTHITATSHGLATGNKIIIRNHTGSTPSINDTIFTVTVLDADHFTIPVNVTVGGTSGTIGVFPSPNTGDLHYMDTYWFTLKDDGTIWNCSQDDPTTWPVGSFIISQMLPGHGIGLAKQNNTLVAFSDRHFQMFYDAANPSGSPLSNIEEAMQQLGCVSSNAIASQENTVYWIANTQTGGFTIYKLDGTTNLKDIGTPTLNRSLNSNFFLTPGSPSAVKIVLTAGTTWTVPADFNKNNNTIEAIGAGGGGAQGSVGFIPPDSGAAGGAGGGGAYAKITNFDPGVAPTIPYTIGVGGSGGIFGGANPTDGTNTTFNTNSVVADSGKKALGSFKGTGGTTASSVGSVKHAGGDGGANPFLINTGGPGGGGAAGPSGNGQNGFDSLGPDGSTGGQGDAFVGGLGGTDADPTARNGGNGTEMGSGVGAGGGGAGGGFASDFPTGNGGLYGAGGGGGGAKETNGGAGSQGLIVITYVPTTSATDAGAANGYVLRLSGHTFYILNLVNTKETWVYDQNYDIWCKWQSTSSNIWPIVNSAQYAPTGMPQSLVGQDPITGTIFQIDPTLGQDNGSNYEVRVQTSPATFGNMKRKFYNNVELIGDQQATSTPVLVSYSDDDYKNFSPPRTFDLSNQRFFSKNWGNSRRRAWRVSYTGPNVIRLFGLEFTIQMENE